MLRKPLRFISSNVSKHNKTGVASSDIYSDRFIKRLMNQDFDFKTINDQMVEIPGGEIVLRDDRIKHIWAVELQPFLLAKYPVTQDLYFWITQESPGTFKGNKKPVETVSWRDAVIFCNSLSNTSRIWFACSTTCLLLAVSNSALAERVKLFWANDVRKLYLGFPVHETKFWVI